MLMDKWHPGYFGKVGLHNSHELKNRKHAPILNSTKLIRVSGHESYDAAKGAEAGKAPDIDLINVGYLKLLGTGVADVLVVIKVKYILKLSQKKIAAGRAYVLAA